MSKRAAKQVAGSAAKKRCTAKAGSKAEEPKDWLKLYKVIERMRRDIEAPVDTMGCHMLADKQAPPEVFRYQQLIALMLSSQTNDAVTSAAMGRLRKHGLDPKNIEATSEEDLKDLIYGVGFYNNKAKYIKKTTDILLAKYDGDTPHTIEEVLKLPGVGPKMGYLFMQVGLGETLGIGVDVHVHRLCNRFKWVKTNTPEQTRVALESWLPKAYWGAINKVLVGFGQTVCHARNPKCSECKAASICPFLRDIEDIESSSSSSSSS
eukprot:TRINITY_DN1282_c0_g1_i1.p1 TRINITY_DN1282_c0_g1~~TRINITY_DN1282_c0_g1_i1.p1  ORF type:complete len:276 (+),score=96.38 TRINITY_DN1282_c0_g1_i1:37-828(+)